MFMKSMSGQGAIEYLLIIAAAILVVAIVILAITGALSSGQSQAGASVVASDDSFDTLKESSSAYIRISKKYFLASSPIVKNTVNLWHLEDLNDSIGTLNGIATGNPTLVDAFIKKGYEFSGTNYITFGNDLAQDLSKDLTIAMWIYPTEISSVRRNPIDKEYGGEFALTLEGGSTLGRMNYYHGQSRSNYFNWIAFSTGTIKANQWQFVAITRESSTLTMKSYYNGEILAETTYSSAKAPAKTTVPIKIGSGYAGGFKGKIDEVIILDKTLTAEEINSLWTGK